MQSGIKQSCLCHVMNYFLTILSCIALCIPSFGLQVDLILKYVVLIFSTERNVIEAAAKGASTAIALVANIAANLIAFLAFLAFFNGVLSWIGSMVGHPELSFEVLVCKLSFSFIFSIHVK